HIGEEDPALSDRPRRQSDRRIRRGTRRRARQGGVLRSGRPGGAARRARRAQSAQSRVARGDATDGRGHRARSARSGGCLMDTEVIAPANAEGTQATVLRWCKRVGDSVEKDEPLLELETDKVTVEIASPASGELTEILKAENEEVQPGQILARVRALDAKN